MKYALHEDDRIEASPGLEGYCPGCGSQLVARCGTKKIWHWAHKGRRHCDHWWEPETEWHRNWKDQFPKEWQEIPSRDDNGELHIADLKTPHGFVVEFQHSRISNDEVRTRTAFHAPMIWIVDGLRRKTDLKQFNEAVRYAFPHYGDKRGISRLFNFECRLIDEWHSLRVLVAFDFGSDDVWLLSGSDDECGVGFWYNKEKLIQDITAGKQVPFVFKEHKDRTGKIVKRTHKVPYSIIDG